MLTKDGSVHIKAAAWTAACTVSLNITEITTLILIILGKNIMTYTMKGLVMKLLN